MLYLYFTNKGGEVTDIEGRYIDRQTDKQIDRQIDRQIDELIDGWIAQ